MGKGRKAIPASNKDKSTYKNVGDIERQKDLEPKGYSNSLPAPKDLPDGARKEWKRIVRLLKQGDSDLINNLDLYLLKMYCVEVDIYNKFLEQWTAENHALFKDDVTDTQRANYSISGIQTSASVGKTTKKQINPLLNELQKHSNTIRVYAEQLGLTPVGRAGWTVRNAKKESSEVDDFMGDE